MLNAVVDLSHYNDPVNFVEAVAGGILGVVHKATEGLTNIDLKYAERRPLAQAAGLLWGAYHLGHSQDGVAQAHHYLSTIGDTNGVLLNELCGLGTVGGACNAQPDWWQKITAPSPALKDS